MTDDHLTDRLPDLLHGTIAWTEGDRRHLERCAECTAEWQLLACVDQRESVAVHEEQVASAVLARLHQSTVLPLRRGPRVRWIVGLAAAAVAVVFFNVLPRGVPGDAAVVPVRAPTLLPELDELLEADLEVLLAMFPATGDAPMGVVPRLGDLTDDELQTLLAEVEG